MRFNKWIGCRVKAHHPRGGYSIGVVLRAGREEGRGVVLTLDSGASIIVRDIVETIKPAVGYSYYVSSYCNYPHSLSTGRPIAHECRYIPIAALRLEREGFTAEAIEILKRRYPQ